MTDRQTDIGSARVESISKKIAKILFSTKVSLLPLSPSFPPRAGLKKFVKKRILSRGKEMASRRLPGITTYVKSGFFY